MKKIFIVMVLMIITVVTQATQATFVDIISPVPGEISPCSISSSRNDTTFNVAGYFSAVSVNKYEGFVYNSGGEWTVLKFPEARITKPRAISGEYVIGSYDDSTTLNHGFLYNMETKVWESFDISTSIGMNTVPSGFYINLNPGQGLTPVFDIVGSYNDSTGRVHSFIYDFINKIWITVKDPLDSIATRFNGICGDNIVGSYEDGLKTHGFLYNKSSKTWSEFTVPFLGASNTVPCGIDKDSVVGYYHVDSTTKSHGFLYNRNLGTWSEITAPRAPDTWCLGVLGELIVGNYNTPEDFIPEGKETKATYIIPYKKGFIYKPLYSTAIPTDIWTRFE